jgi:DNA invertase Pin-like site-specific DNA recombinase
MSLDRSSNAKVRPEHLARTAVVYLRQSSLRQVRENQESQLLQYALVNRARSLGWQSIDVVDADLGRSAALGARRRPGFEQVISKVALGEVGVVLSREVSRLSRTDRDWCRLLEVCQIFGTLIGDEDQIYDLDQLDDQLLLGIKGTLSVVELKVLKARMQSGMEAKARRGEFRHQLPSGYVYDADGRPVKDPDLRVQNAIGLMFEKFRVFGCVRQFYNWIVDEGLEFPVRRYVGSRLKTTWYVPPLLWVAHVLKNPFYAGAYVHGRRPREAIVVDGKVVKRTGALRAPENAKVFLPDHHEGYIDWITFKENQRMISENRPRRELDDESRTAARDGAALLVGLLRCGRCGRRFHVHYWGSSGCCPQYMCKGEYDLGGDRCIAFAGASVEGAVIEQVLRVVSPMGVDASLLAIETLKEKGTERLSSLKRRLEQLEYEATRAFEQYDEVDPRNRLVASELERRWNSKLEECTLVRAELAKQIEAQREIDDRAIHRIRELGARFEEVWHDPACTPILKKKILRTALEEIIVSRVDNEISLVLHWVGGIHTKLSVRMPSAKSARRTPDEALDTLRKLAAKYDDACIASVLNRNGLRTGAGKEWTASRVRSARKNHSIDGGVSRPPPGTLNMKRASQKYAVTIYAIERLVDAGLVRNEQTVPFAPSELREEDLDSDRVQRVLRDFQKTGRIVVAGGATKNQIDLFEQIQGDDNARSRG